MDGTVTRLTATTTPPAEPVSNAGVVAAETANGGVAVRKDEAATAPQGESLILGKFKDQAALEKAYKELEAKQGGKKEEAAPVVKPPVTPDDASKAVAKAGLDMAALTKEYADNAGKLSDASMQALAAAGITPEQVATYVQGQVAISDQIAADFAAVAGGQAKLDSLLDWAKANATDEQKAAFDAALESGNGNLAKLALQGIKAAYDSAVGVDPKLVKGPTTTGDSGPQPFASQQEITAAMKDPRWKSGDKAYMKQVEARLAKTEIWR